MGRIRNEEYVKAGRKKIQEASVYGLSMAEMIHYRTRAYTEELPDLALADIFYLGVEAGYRMASNRPQRESYEMGYQDGIKAAKNRR